MLLLHRDLLNVNDSFCSAVPSLLTGINRVLCVSAYQNEEVILIDKINVSV